MKKVFSFTFLTIFLFNVAGYFLVFEIEQFHIKSEIRSRIKQGIDTEYLTIITINKTDAKSIEWMEADKELRYKDELYDVVKFVETEKMINYYCINDSEEMSLFENLGSHINKHIGANSTQKKSEKSTDHIVKIYFPSELLLVVPAISESSDQLFSDHSMLTSAVIQKNILPPEFA